MNFIPELHVFIVFLCLGQESETERNAAWSLRGYVRFTQARSQQGISGAYNTHLLLRQQDCENLMFTCARTIFGLF